MASAQDACQHQVVYAGVTNLTRGFGIMGAVDVWTCLRCHDIWCDEKRIEHQELPPEVGLPTRIVGSEWAVLLCDNGARLDWNVVQVRQGDVFQHSCAAFESCRLTVLSDWTLTCSSGHGNSHRLILIRPSINKTLRV